MPSLRESHELEHDAIKAIIGDGQLDPSSTMAALDALGVSNQDFTDTAKASLFDALSAQMRSGQQPEIHSIVKTTKGVCTAQMVLSAFMASEIGMLTPRLKVLAEGAAQRRLVSALEKSLELARSSKDLGAVVTEAMEALATFKTPTLGPRSADSEVMGLVDEVEANASGARSPCLETGIPSLDALIGGLPPTLTTIGSMPGVGKSALLAKILGNLAGKGTRVGVFSLEDQARWFIRRMVSEQSAIPVFVLQNRKLEQGQLEKFGDACGPVHETARSIIVDDRKGLSPKDIVATARVMVQRYGVKALFVDHLGEIHLDRTDRHDLDIAECLRDLRAMADLYKIPMVVLCHVRRRPGLERTDAPELTDFAFSAAVERMARLAIGLSQRYDEHKRPVALGVHILKQTQGLPNVETWLGFNGPAAMASNEEANNDEA